MSNLFEAARERLSGSTANVPERLRSFSGQVPTLSRLGATANTVPVNSDGGSSGSVSSGSSSEAAGNGLEGGEKVSTSRSFASGTDISAAHAHRLAADVTVGNGNVGGGRERLTDRAGPGHSRAVGPANGSGSVSESSPGLLTSNERVVHHHKRGESDTLAAIGATSSSIDRI
ncbi:LADA_0G01552g1_1 [Lachancea dasiensis]|uniref:LADA_0G01552g1_1 n=1 Tax=Lachancea dasiensis TaxID=1072105 RepID=A0A1G4JQQ7_9SACH|nr:LADA_0G01552g1_1 [Lachancea dasiensis]